MADRKMEIKSFPALGTKVTNDKQGIVEHIITVFGVYDLGGDISHPGSFRKTLAERGNKVKVVDSHNYTSTESAIAKPLEMREVTRNELPPDVLNEYPEATGGVWARTKFLLNTRLGKEIFTRIDEDVIDEWSYGYDALDFDYTKEVVGGKEVTVRNLRTVKLWEYSPVLFGMNPATVTMSAKDAKPAPEVTENTIRIRVRDPGDFQENSFRTINVGDADNGIQAVIGKLEGQTTTTIQSYIFDKEKWTVARARSWVDEHSKALNDAQGEALEAEMEGSETPEAEVKKITDEDKRVIERELRALSMRDLVANHRRLHMYAAQGNILTGFTRGDMGWYHAAVEKELRRRAEQDDREPPEATPLEWGSKEGDEGGESEPGDEDEKHMVGRVGVIRRREEGKAVETARTEPETMTEEGGDVEPPTGEKAGRVLAARNVSRARQALQALIDIFEDAGVDTGYSRVEKEEEDDEKDTEKKPKKGKCPWHIAEDGYLVDENGERADAEEFAKWVVEEHERRKADDAPAETQAAMEGEEQLADQAGPDDEPPTSSKERMLKLLNLEIASLETLEVESGQHQGGNRRE